MTNQQKIYAELVKFSAPASLPALWAACEAAPTFRAPLSESAAKTALRASFSEHDLLAAGVFVRTPRPAGQDNGPQTAVDPGPETSANPDLVCVNPGLLLSPWLVLRQADDSPPYDIVTERGCLSGPCLPLFAMLDDDSTTRLLEECDDELLGANSLADTFILQSLGFAAAPTCGLDKLTGAPLDEFFRLLDVRSLNGYALSDDESDEAELQPKNLPPETPVSTPPQKPAPQRPKCRLRLTLVDWQPCGLSPAKLDNVASIRCYLTEAAKHLDLLLDQVSVWEPTASTITKLSWALQNASPGHVRRLLLVSLDNSTRELIPRCCQRTRDFGPDPDLAAQHTGAGSDWESDGALNFADRNDAAVDIAAGSGSRRRPGEGQCCK